MRVSVNYSGLQDLESDLTKIPVQATKDMVSIVREGIKVGNTLARDNARRTAGKHGKLYPRSFSSEMRGVSGGFGTYSISGEYGPDAAKPQGNMEFEYGSRQSPAHLDLNHSADVVGPALQGELRSKIDSWFWPES